MEKVTFKWPLIGAVLGLLGFIPSLLELGAIINGVEVGHNLELVSDALCPAALLRLGFWWTLGLNCLLYALLTTFIRLAWIGLRHRSISN